MAKRTFLDFEQPVAELESKIEELRYVQTESAVDISEEIDQLSKKSQQLTKEIYSDLTPWQITKIARHPERPYTLDYVQRLFTDWIELHGKRFADEQVEIEKSRRGPYPAAWQFALSVTKKERERKFKEIVTQNQPGSANPTSAIQNPKSD